MNMRSASAAALIGLALLSAAPASASDFGVPENYRLSLETAETCHVAMMAVMTDAKSDAKLKAELAAFGKDDEDEDGDENGDTLTVQEATARMEELAPTAARTMSRKGCAPEAFWTSMMAMIEAGMYVAVSQMGGEIEIPAVTKENIAVLTKHQARFEKMGAEQRAASEALGLE